MSTPAFVSWWPAPRNLRPSVTRLAADRDEPDRDREHDQADERDAPRAGAQRARRSVPPRGARRRTRRTRPRRSCRRRRQCPRAHAQRRSRAVRAPVRGRTARARAPRRTAPRSRGRRAATACVTRQACGRGCRARRRIAGRRPRSRRSSSRSAPPPRRGGRARLDDQEHRRREQHVLEPLRRRDGVRARRIAGKWTAPQATPRARAARARRARSRPAATRRERAGRARPTDRGHEHREHGDIGEERVDRADARRRLVVAVQQEEGQSRRDDERPAPARGRCGRGTANGSHYTRPPQMRFRVLWRRVATAVGIYGSALLGILATVVAARELTKIDFSRFALVFAVTGLLAALPRPDGRGGRRQVRQPVRRARRLGAVPAAVRVGAAR